MYCTQCGATVDGKRFCSICGRRVPAPSPPPPAPSPAAFVAAPPPLAPPPLPPPPLAPADLKGRFILKAKTVSAPFNSAVGYGFAAAAGVLLVALGIAMRKHSHDGILFAGLALYLCFTAFVGMLISRIPRSIRVYERGLEKDIPRSFNMTSWLAWSRVTEYRWDGDVLYCAWEPNAVIVLKNGSERGSWRMPPFPKAVRIPEPQVSEVAALLREHAPPPRPS